MTTPPPNSAAALEPHLGAGHAIGGGHIVAGGVVRGGGAGAAGDGAQAGAVEGGAHAPGRLLGAREEPRGRHVHCGWKERRARGHAVKLAAGCQGRAPISRSLLHSRPPAPTHRRRRRWRSAERPHLPPRRLSSHRGHAAAVASQRAGLLGTCKLGWKFPHHVALPPSHPHLRPRRPGSARRWRHRSCRCSSTPRSTAGPGEGEGEAGRRRQGGRRLL